MARARRQGSAEFPAPQTLVEADFSKGQISDADSGALGPGQMLACTNFMLDKPGKIYKRGGHEYVGNAAGVLNYRVELAEFPSPTKTELLMWSSNLRLYRLVAGTWTATGAPTNYGATTGYLPRQRPVMVADPANTNTTGALVWGVAAGNDLPRVYPGNGAAVRTINAATGITSGGFGDGRYFTYYKSRFVIGGSTKYENRMWFSPAGVLADIEGAWDTTSWIDFDYAITGLAALSNVLLVFSRSHFARITGNSPPPGGDMSQGPIARTGCADSRSIAIWNDNAIWASLDGVYLSSGTAPLDLTAQGGIKNAWIAATEGWVEGDSYISGAIYRDFYFVTISTDTQEVTWVLDIPRRVWWKLDFAAGTPWWYGWNPIDAGQFYCVFATDRVMNIAPIFQTPADNNQDAGAGIIVASLQTRPLNAGMVGIKNWRDGRVDYQISRSDAGGTPSLDLSIAGRSSGLSVSETLVTEEIRARTPFTIAGSDEAITLTLEQSGRTNVCELYGFEIDFRPMPLDRGGAI